MTKWTSKRPLSHAKPMILVNSGKLIWATKASSSSVGCWATWVRKGSSKRSRVRPVRPCPMCKCVETFGTGWTRENMKAERYGGFNNKMWVFWPSESKVIQCGSRKIGCILVLPTQQFDMLMKIRGCNKPKFGCNDVKSYATIKL